MSTYACVRSGSWRGHALHMLQRCLRTHPAVRSVRLVVLVVEADVAHLEGGAVRAEVVNALRFVFCLMLMLMCGDVNQV